MQEFAPAHIQEKLKERKVFFDSLHITLKIWNESQIVQLIAKEYPLYLERYLKILNTIQRCDLARAFLLHFFGGVYMDVDFRPLEKHREFFIQDWYKRDEVRVGTNELLGVNNAWIYSNKGNSFWYDYLDYAFAEIQEPALLNICIKIMFPTWEVISSTGPIVYYTLKDKLIVDSRVFGEWGMHGELAEPTWFNKSTNVKQTVLVSLLLLGCFGFFLTAMLCSTSMEVDLSDI